MNLKETIGARLNNIRNQKRMSQSELAGKLSVSQRAISHWENGTNEMPYHIVVKVCEIFSVDPNYLFGFAGSEDKQIAEVISRLHRVEYMLKNISK